MASGVAVLFGDKTRSQTKHFSYLFQFVTAKYPVHEGALTPIVQSARLEYACAATSVHHADHSAPT